MNPPVVSNCGTRDPKQPGAHTAQVTLEIETTHNFEKDLRGQVLSLLAISHLTIDEAVDQAKVFLVKWLKIPCIHYLAIFCTRCAVLVHSVCQLSKSPSLIRAAVARHSPMSAQS